MACYRFVTVDVFTDRRFGGNPLAVFPEAQGLSDVQMQALAREFNLSETTFVLPPENPAHTAQVRIFNTSHEMAFAGHPNVGTGVVLAREGRDAGGRLLFEERAGLVGIEIERDTAGEVVAAGVAAPQPLSVLAEIAPEAVAACAGLQASGLRLEAHRPLLASTGNPLVFAEVELEALRQAVPDRQAFVRAVADHPALQGRMGLYLYALDGAAVRARMFSPLDGTWEDPATGSAATTLATLLLSRGDNTTGEWAIHQGLEMRRPSLLRASAQRQPEGIRGQVSGACVTVLSGTVELD